MRNGGSKSIAYGVHGGTAAASADMTTVTHYGGIASTSK
jgi:hypothetical protein